MANLTDFVTVTAGKFNATIIEVIKEPTDIKSLVSLVETEEKKNTKGAVYIYFPFTWAMTNQVLPVMFNQLSQFKLRATYDWKGDGQLYMEYYHWMNQDIPDMVPAFATSISGVTVLLHDDDKQVIFIVEKGRFNGKKKFPGGAVEPKENAVQAAIREVKEEVGLQEDALDQKEMAVLAGYTQGNARPGGINDQFHGISIKVKGRFQDLALKKQDHEVKEIHILKLQDILDMPAEQQQAEFLGNAVLMIQRHAANAGFKLAQKKNNTVEF